MCLCGGPVACFCRRIQRTEVAAEYMFSPQGAFVVPHKELAQGAGLEFANATPDVRTSTGQHKGHPTVQRSHSARTADDCAMLRVSLAAVKIVEGW